MDTDSFQPKTRNLRISSLWGMGCLFVLLCTMACSSGEGRSRQKIQTGDSLPFMHSIGVSTLISDSGIIRYHLVAEEWDIYTPSSQAATWKFIKGLLMLRLDENLDVDLYVQADTAYLHKQQTWELRGRVRIRNVQGTIFKTEELFWDLDKHEMWNHAYMTIITPERTLEGTEFRSNEQMTRYSVANSKGNFPMSDADGDTAPADSTTTETTATATEKSAPSTERVTSTATKTPAAATKTPAITTNEGAAKAAKSNLDTQTKNNMKVASDKPMAPIKQD